MTGWWFALLPAAAAVLVGPALVGTSALAAGDYVTYWYPVFGFLGDAFRKYRELPFWMPGILGGMPLGESLGPSVWYPTDVAGWLLHLPPARRVAFDVWVHLAIAGAGGCRLAAACGARPAAAVAGGLIFMLGGYPVDLVRNGTLVFLRGFAWLPWIFWAVSRAVSAGRVRGWLGVAALLALLPLAAAQQLLAYLVIVLPAFAAAMAPRGRRWGAVAGTCAAAAGAGLLAAVVVLPAFRYYGLSLRSAGGIDLSAMGRLEFSDLPHLLTPSLWGKHAGDTGKYLGLLPALLALVGLAGRPRLGLPWALLGAVAVVLALGTATPAGALLARLPLYGGFRTSAHWLGVTQLACAVCAAFGIDLLRVVPRRGWRIAAAAAVLAAGELVARGVGRVVLAPPDSVPGAAMPEDLLSGELRKKPGPFRISTDEYATFPNMRMSAGLEWVQGYHGAPLSVFARFYDAAVRQRPRVPGLFSWLNVRYYLVADPSEFPSLVPRTAVVNLAGQRTILCEDPGCLPRAFFAARVEASGTDAEVLGALGRAPAAGRRVFVAGPRGPALAGRKTPGTVGRLDLAPNRITADVASSGDGFLFFSEAWYPAWIGFVDGVRVPIERVNVMFRGVAVPEGRHTVEMVYASLPFAFGLWLSCLAWAALALYLGTVRPARPPAPSHEIAVQGP